MTQREPLPPDLRQGFAHLIEARLGLVFPASREPFLDQSVHDALERLGEISARVLLDRLQHDDVHAWDALTGTVTVGETYFFRDRAHYELLRTLLTRAAPGRSIRLWSAACASGAEAYSMAAIACEVFGRQAPRRVEILATDVNPQALEQAHAGIYRPWLLRDMDEATRACWFTPEDGSWRVRPALAEMVRFARLNLIDLDRTAWPGSMDVIFCRNVLLYFSQPAMEQAAQGLAQSLQPDGLLIVGPSDPLLTTPLLALDVSRPGVLAYRRAPAAPAVPASSPPRRNPALPPPPPVHHRTPRTTPRHLRSTWAGAAAVPAPPEPSPDAAQALARARALGDAGHLEAALAEAHVRARLRAPGSRSLPAARCSASGPGRSPRRDRGRAPGAAPRPQARVRASRAGHLARCAGRSWPRAPCPAQRTRYSGDTAR